MSNISPPGLEQLRDIHLPGEPSWWPPAWGWWLVLGVVLCIGVGKYFIDRRQEKKKGAPDLTQLMRNELQQLEDEFALSGDMQKMLANLSSLLKRGAMAKYGREATAGLSGPQWADFWQNKGFALSVEERESLIIAPYQPAQAATVARLRTLVEQLLFSSPDKAQVK